MSTTAATLRDGVLERRFRFSEHGTTLARDTMAGVTTFVVMSYIIFLNPIILTSVKPKVGSPLPFEGVVTATCVVAAVMTILMGLYTNKAYALAPGLGINAIVAFQLVGQQGLSFPSAMGLIVCEGIVVTVLVLTGAREAIMRAIPLELKKAIAIGIGLFIAFIGLYNSGIVVPAVGEPVTLGRFTTWPIFVTFVGIIVTLLLRARGFKGDLLVGIIGTTVVATIVNSATSHKAFGTSTATWPGWHHIAGWGNWSLFGNFDFHAFSKLGVVVGDRLGVRPLPVGFLRHDGDARRGRQAGRLSEREGRDAGDRQAAAHRLARRDGGRGVVGVVGHDVHRVGRRRCRRRPDGLGGRHRRGAVPAVPVLRTADRDGAGAGHSRRAHHRRLPDGQCADRGRGRG